MYLNSYSKVTVKIVAPVLNETATKIPKTFGGTETSKTTSIVKCKTSFLTASM